MNEVLASARNELYSNLNVNVITTIIMTRMALTAMTVVAVTLPMIDAFAFGAAVTERIYSLSASARYLPVGYVIMTFDSGPA